MGEDQFCEYWGQSQVGLGAQWSVNTTLSSCLSSWQPPWAEGHPQRPGIGWEPEGRELGSPMLPNQLLPSPPIQCL